MALHTHVTAIMAPHPTSAGPDDTLARVQALMFEGRSHHIPVVEDGRLVGLVSANDLKRAGPDERTTRAPEIRAALERVRVREVMSADPVTVRPTDTVSRAAELLGIDSFHSLPVVDGDGRLLGMVTTGDIIRFLSHRVPRRPA